MARMARARVHPVCALPSRKLLALVKILTCAVPTAAGTTSGTPEGSNTTTVVVVVLVTLPNAT